MNRHVEWRVSVNTTENWNEMTIRNVTTDDSGEYSCHEVGLENTATKVIFYLDVKGTSSNCLLTETTSNS